jgi:hypothetical protein
MRAPGVNGGESKTLPANSVLLVQEIKENTKTDGGQQSDENAQQGGSEMLFANRTFWGAEQEL